MPTELVKLTKGQEDQLTKQLDRCLELIEKAKTDIVTRVLVIGEQLKQAHDLYSGVGRSGGFMPWVEKNCAFGKTTAYNYMNAFEVFGPHKALVDRFEADSLYLLSRQITPEEAVRRALRVAKRGLFVTEAKAREIIDSCRPEDDDDQLDEQPTDEPAEPDQEAFTQTDALTPENKARPEPKPEPVRPFANLVELPDEWADWMGNGNLLVISAKRSGWKLVSLSDLRAILDGIWTVATTADDENE